MGLHLFVMFSSLTVACGNAGQCNHSHGDVEAHGGAHGGVTSRWGRADTHPVEGGHIKARESAPTGAQGRAVLLLVAVLQQPRPVIDIRRHNRVPKHSSDGTEERLPHRAGPALTASSSRRIGLRNCTMAGSAAREVKMAKKRLYAILSFAPWGA